MVTIGIEKIHKLKKKIKGKKIGILTNNMSRDHNLESTLELFKKDFKNITLLVPEHGYYGEEQAGRSVKNTELNDIDVISLYYGNISINNEDIDKSMRELDTSLKVENFLPKEINEIDTIIVDLQDIGNRVYTYASTMILLLENFQNDLIILDRPNPVTGKYIEGPILKKEYKSFIGMQEIPLRHGLTMGELANFYTHFYKERENMSIVKMSGWKREMWFPETGLIWVSPSPNIPTFETSIAYQGNVIFEGTNVSEGRGTTRPFQIIGSPWADPLKIARNINKKSNGEYKVIETRFRPSFSKYKDESCGGIDLHIINIEKFKPFYFSIQLLNEFMEYSEFNFYDNYFDNLMGTDEIRKKLINNDIDDIFEYVENDINDFIKIRREILIY